MAKKKTAQEPCLFCGYNPCRCDEERTEEEEEDEET